MWKCLRTLLTNEVNLKIGLNLDGLCEDLSGFFVDLFAGLGGGCYAIGTYYFQYVVTDEDEIYAANWFLFGGIFFTLSGFSMFYRYFLKKKNEGVGFENGENFSKDVLLVLS